MKKSTIGIVLMIGILCSISAYAIPIPTSVFGTVDGLSSPEISIQVKAGRQLIDEQRTVTYEDGKYAMVATTEGIQLVNITLMVFNNGAEVHKKVFLQVETGSKIEHNMEFVTEDNEPSQETDIERPAGGGGGGGGGGTNEPKLADIQNLLPIIIDKPADISKDRQTEQQQGSSDTGTQEPSQNEDKIQEEPNQQKTDEPSGLPKIAEKISSNKNYFLAVLGAVLLLLLIVIIISDRIKKNE